MDKSIFEKYIQEMRAMQAVAMPAPIAPPVPQAPPATHVESEPNSSDMSGMGKLIVNVTSVRGLYPVEGARVTVFTGETDNMNVIAEVTTDRSGKTPAIELPAPSIRFSESPDPSERPYAYYNIRTIADGFVENLNYNAAVFDSVTSLLNVDLQPLTTGVGGNRPIIIDGFDNYTL